MPDHLRRDRPEHAERVPRRPPRAGRRRLRHQGRPWRRAPRWLESGDGGALDRRAAGRNRRSTIRNAPQRSPTIGRISAVRRRSSRSSSRRGTTGFRSRCREFSRACPRAMPDRIRRRGRSPAAKPFKPRPGATPEQIAQQRKAYDATQAELEKLPLNGVRVGSVDVGGPYSQPAGPSRASLQKIYTCGHLVESAHTPMCATRIMTDLTRRAFRRPVTSGEVQKYVRLVRLAQEQEHSLAEGLAVGIQALLVSPGFPVPHRKGPSRRPGEDDRADQPARTGHQAFLLPVGEHARRRAAAGRRCRHAAQSGGSRRAGATHAARPEGERARRKLRRTMAAVPRTRIDDAGSGTLSRLRGLPAALHASRNRALRRPHRPRRRQHPRLHRRTILVSERTAGSPLRRRRRQRTRVPARRFIGDARGRACSRRAAC